MDDEARRELDDLKSQLADIRDLLQSTTGETVTLKGVRVREEHSIFVGQPWKFLGWIGDFAIYGVQKISYCAGLVTVAAVLNTAVTGQPPNWAPIAITQNGREFVIEFVKRMGQPSHLPVSDDADDDLFVGLGLDPDHNDDSVA